MNFKNIHIGKLVENRMVEYKIDITRACNFLKCSEEDILSMFRQENLDTGILLKWCKLLEYDFFRLYSQHLILYAPPKKNINNEKPLEKSNLPQFRKNIYTKEIIDFILECIESGAKSKQQVMKEYKIPKTTLYKWIAKYKNQTS